MQHVRSRILSLVVIGALVLPWSPVTGQSSEDEVLIVDDPTGDVVFEFNGQKQDSPASYDTADLTGAWMGPENETHISMGFSVAQWYAADGTELIVQGRELSVVFRFRGEDYRITPALCQGEWRGLLSRHVDSGFSPWSRVIDCLPSTLDAQTGSFEAAVPKEYITDADQTPIRFGDRIDGFYAHVRQLVATGLFSSGGLANTTVYAMDWAPDVGYSPAFKITKGRTGEGDLQLATSESIRYSNGEATTLVYRVFVDNFAAEAMDVLLTLEGVEEGWNARIPARVSVGAESTAEVPVIVSMGFTHRHGETATIRVKAADAQDPTVTAQLNLGIHWLEIPQPAGHHDILYFHSSSSRLFDMWMNPSPEDPRPGVDDPPVTSFSSGSSGTDTYNYWQAVLDPALLVGLDFDLGRTATFAASFSSRQVIREAYVNATVLYCNPAANTTGFSSQCGQGAWVPIAYGESETAGIDPGQTKEFIVEMPILKTADLLPYRAGSNLRLEIDLSGIGVVLGGTTDFVPKESSLTLPLIEYHDPVDQAFQDIGSLALQPLGAFEKPVNPGRTAIFPFMVSNKAQEAQTVDLVIEGHNSEWASWSGPSTTLSLAPGEDKKVLLAVAVPAHASEGERAELFAVVENADDPSIVAISRIRAAVVEGVEIPDEAASLDAGAPVEAPGFEILVLLAALGLALRRTSRR